MLPIIFLSIDLFGVDRCITALRCWKDLGMSCCVRCCKHSGHAADQCGSEIASSSFMCHCLTSWGIWDIRVVVFHTHPNLRATGKQKANSEPQISSSCPRWENKRLFSGATPPHLFSSLSLLHLCIPESCGFFITGLLSSRACSPLLARTLISLSGLLLPSSVYCLYFDSYLSQPRELLDPLDPSLSLSWGRPSADWRHLSACNEGLRLWSEVSPPHGPAERGCHDRCLKTPECVCVCVRTGTALSHCVRTGLTL